MVVLRTVRNRLFLCMLAVGIAFGGCSRQADELPQPDTPSSVREEAPAPEPDAEKTALQKWREWEDISEDEIALLDRFYADAHVEQADQLILERAIFSGRADQYDPPNWNIRNALFPYRSDHRDYDIQTIFYHIGMVYYDGLDGTGERSGVPMDRQKALDWFDAAAGRGNAYAAILAGDMLAQGDAVPLDLQGAFQRYSHALAIEADGKAYQRLGLCYREGIGVAANNELARRYFQQSAYQADRQGLYELSAMTDPSQPGAFALYKAASSAAYGPGYFAVAYGGREAYAADQQKMDLVGWIVDGWEQATDPVTDRLKRAVRGNSYYSEELVEQLVKTFYSYSYWSFVEQHALADYTADYDGDGELERGYSRHSHAGGARQSDGFVIYKQGQEPQNELDLWGDDAFAQGPPASLRDGMRLIEYDGRVYFLINYYSEDLDALYDIHAYTLDEQGRGHTLGVTCTDYAATLADACAQEGFQMGYEALFTELDRHVKLAVAATRQHTMYRAEGETALEVDDEPPLQYWCFAADVNNDGEEDAVYRAHFRTESAEGANVSFYSKDDKRTRLPYTGWLSQFWTVEYEGLTYCAALTRQNYLYTLQVYLIQGEDVQPVYKALYLDEAQTISVDFEVDL